MGRLGASLLLLAGVLAGIGEALSSLPGVS